MVKKHVPSWHDDETYARLRRRNVALCVVDDDAGTTPVVPTADFGYLRLRRTRYTAPRIAEWVTRLRAQPWTEASVFFKHEDTGTGPRFGQSLQRALARPARPLRRTTR